MCLFALRFTEKTEDAEDVVQQVFADVWDKNSHDNTSNFSVMPDKSIHLYDYVENAGKVSALLSANNIIIYQLAQSGDSLETYYTNLKYSVRFPTKHW